MDEVKINITMTKLKQQMENVAEDIKEIKDMLKVKGAVDEEQNKNIALLQNVTATLQQQKNVCSASKDSAIERLNEITQSNHDQIREVSINFDKYEEYTTQQQNKLKFQISILVPLITTTLTFGVDFILRMMHM